MIRVSYTDGFGRVALNKAQCKPVTVALDSTHSFTAHWVCSGKTIYNNKGKEVMQYEPFFCYDHRFNDDEYQAEAGISPKLYYDPLGRVKRTEMPDGTYSFTTWDNWKQTVYDANDTVVIGSGPSAVSSGWYIAKSAGSAEEQDAADKAAQHAETPAIMYLDTLARPFFTVQQYQRVDVQNTNPFYLSYEDLDIAGNRMSVHDATGKVPLTYQYNMLHAPCYQQSVDGGTQKMLMDVAGQPMHNWDAEERLFSVGYDALRRPVAQYLGAIADGYILSKTVYADGPSADPVKNLRGKVLESYDGGGKHYVEEYDFKGQPVASMTKLIESYQLTDADWGTPPALASWETIATAVTDALGRPITITTTDTLTNTTNITRHEYDKGGLLKAVYLNAGNGEETYVQDIHYDAKGQRQNIWYGNGTKTRYTYDPQTYRLKRLYTVNLTAGDHYNEKLQDLNYYYDAVGNITQVRDDGQPVLFYNNTIIEPVKDYTYDAIYRLIRAKGREQAGANNYDADNYKDKGHLVDPVDNNPHAVRDYLQTYTYDGAGNMLTLKHDTGGSGGYTRRFFQVGGTNRLDYTNVTGITTPFSYSYDARGNMRSMPHLSVMDWDVQNQLSYVKAGTTDAWYQYSGGQRIRKTVYKAGIREERIYLGGYEIYRKFEGSSLKIVRTTVHITDDTGRIAMLEKRTYGDDDSPAILKRFIYSNHLQSASLEVDEDGEIISYEEYHPYGTTAYQARNSTINAVAKRYRFTGKERDEESGLNYHGARYYALWLCRWISVDPLESKYAGMSSYNYGFNNPISYNDPSGMEGEENNKGDYRNRNSLIQNINSSSSTGRVPIVPTPANYSAPATSIPQYSQMKIGSSNKVPQNDHTRVVKPVSSSAVHPVQKEPEILSADVYGKGYIGPQSVVRGQAFRANLQWGEDIKGGMFGAVGSMAGGPKGARAGAVVDGVVMSVAPNSGTPFGNLEIATEPIREPFIATSGGKAKGNTFPVASEFIPKDVSKGYLKNGNYSTNPTSKIPSDFVVTPGGNVKLNNAKTALTGEYMYTVDAGGQLHIGTRARSYEGFGDGASHPTLIGGKDPVVLTAGMVTFRNGKIYSIDNFSGHFKPTAESITIAKAAFEKAFPNSFAKNFAGYFTFSMSSNGPVKHQVHFFNGYR